MSPNGIAIKGLFGAILGNKVLWRFPSGTLRDRSFHSNQKRRSPHL
ncbi:hypothetical protein [Laspinema olomoucense]|nr:hypothetical protein [Laspinema sp. D3a]MCT7990690.1 hypothetical protein [Laspinema sp. D3a]